MAKTTLASKTLATFFLSLLFSSVLCTAIPFKPPHIPHKLPPPNPFCPRDAPKFSVCADLLGDVVNLVAGEQMLCIVSRFADAEAALCLCTAIKEGILNVLTTEWLVAVSLLVSSCKKKIPDGFKCV